MRGKLVERATARALGARLSRATPRTRRAVWSPEPDEPNVPFLEDSGRSDVVSPPVDETPSEPADRLVMPKFDPVEVAVPADVAHRPPVVAGWWTSRSHLVFVGVSITALVLLTAGLLSFDSLRRSSSSNLTAAPGYRSAPGAGGRAADDGSFELAGPSGASSATTIPGALLPQPTQPPPASVPETTTTTALAPLEVPEVAGIINLCGFERMFAPFENLVNEGPAEARPLIEGLVAAMERYVEVAPDDQRQNIETVKDQVVGLRQILANGGWDPKSEGYLQALQVITADATQPGSFSERLQRIVQAERATCA